MSFAETTTVSVEKSKAELDAMLARAGARQRGVYHDDAKGAATVVFAIGAGEAMRQVRLTLPLPKLETFGRIRRRNLMVTATPEQQRKGHEQACRTRWRAMVLLVKAKLEAVAIGVSTIEREFLADIFLGDGHTVHEAAQAALTEYYRTGSACPLQLGPKPPSP